MLYIKGYEPWDVAFKTLLCDNLKSMSVFPKCGGRVPLPPPHRLTHMVHSLHLYVKLREKKLYKILRNNATKGW